MFDYIKEKIFGKSEDLKFIENLISSDNDNWKLSKDEFGDEYYLLEIKLDDGRIQKIILQRDVGLCCTYEGISDLPSITLKTEGPLLDKEFSEYEYYKPMLKLYYKVSSLFIFVDKDSFNNEFLTDKEKDERLKRLNEYLTNNDRR